MALIPAPTLRRIRQEMAKTLTQTATIQAPTKVPKETGGEETTFATVATVPCRLQPVGQGGPNSTLVVGNRVIARNFWRVRVPNGTVIPTGGRILVGAHTLAVLAVNDYPDQVTLSIYCREDL